MDKGIRRLRSNERITRVRSTINVTYAAFSKSVSCTLKKQTVQPVTNMSLNKCYITYYLNIFIVKIIGTVTLKSNLVESCEKPYVFFNKVVILLKFQ